MNPSAPGASHQVTHNAIQLPVPLLAVLFHSLRTNECSRPLVRIQEAADLKLAVGADYCVRIDGKVHRQLAHRGKLVAAHQTPGSDPGEHLVHNLAIDGNSRPQIELEVKWRAGLSCFSHFNY